ncbi:tripartite tricarboxylate transporter substrate binding protein [soil metagenome]
MFRRSFCSALLLGVPWIARAQNTAGDWPSKAVRVVVPYAPGGTADTLGRLASQHLQGAFKQPFAVENKGGGGGTIGSGQVAKAAPDGYNLVVSGIGSHVIAPVDIKAFDPMADFTHIALLGGPPTVLVINAAEPPRDLKAFIAYAKASKDGLSWGSPGQGTHGHLIGELFNRQAKIPHTHVSYKGAAPAVADLLGGQIPAAFVTLTSANAFIKAGKIRALAITSAARRSDLADVPTFAEQGYPELVATTWFSLSGPPGMPPALVEKINKEVRAGLKTEAMQKQLALEAIETQDLDAAAFTRYMRSEIDRWTPLVKSVDKPKAT